MGGSKSEKNWEVCLEIDDGWIGLLVTDFKYVMKNEISLNKKIS
jgi:hypothetical protein